MERNWGGMKDTISCKIDPFTREKYKLDKSDMWKDFPFSPDR